MIHFKKLDVSVCYWFFSALEQAGGKKKEKSTHCLLFLLDFITCSNMGDRLLQLDLWGSNRQQLPGYKVALLYIHFIYLHMF